MISTQDAMSAITLLVKAGYVNATEAQADVWAAVINEGAPWATSGDIARAVRDIATQPRAWVSTGDLVAELHKVRERAAHEERRRLQIERTPEDNRPIPRERLREIFAQHGLDPWQHKESN